MPDSNPGPLVRYISTEFVLVLIRIFSQIQHVHEANLEQTKAHGILYYCANEAEASVINRSFYCKSKVRIQ